ncbi:hypothetical protein [Cohnella zeiphila]|uniref:Uncharacterized protein n=1 Tax=Cohnella zeiphila TaxID=2761120 RepID=A0A7X0SJN0_9BACL|nr:hypothetical protein [Cohnella zeiphila]MBB6731176.1 hypothetical protein [Cohnella zeiphila]
MRVPKFAKVLLLSTAILTAAAPAYAERNITPLSNTLTATFNVTSNFTLQWTDGVGVLPSAELPEITAGTGEVKDLNMKATVSRPYDYQVLFVISRTDGTAISETDAVLEDDSVTPADEIDGNISGLDNKLHIYSRGRSITDTDDLHFGVKFLTAGQYKIEAFAVEEPM